MKIRRRDSARFVRRRKQKLNMNGNDGLFCTRRQRRIIYAALELRLPIYRAIDLAGVTANQYHYWMKRGVDKKNRRYYYFRKRVLEYKTQKEIEALRTIEEAQRGGYLVRETKIHRGGKYGREVTKTRKTLAPKWTAAAWWLERTYPEEYALRPDKADANFDPVEKAKQIRAALEDIDNTVPDEEDEDI